MTSRCSVSAGSRPMSATTTSPAWKRPGRDREADLRAVHRDGHVGVHRRARDLAGRRVHAGRDVDREHGDAGCVDLLDERATSPRAARPSARCRGARRSRRPAARPRARVPARAGSRRRSARRRRSRRRRREARSGARRGSGASAPPRRPRPRAASSRRRRDPPRRRASPPRSRAARAQPSEATATACASSRECVIERSTEPTPSAAARSASRPERRTAGFGRPAISISCQAKARATPKPSALPTASLPAKRPA